LSFTGSATGARLKSDVSDQMALGLQTI